MSQMTVGREKWEAKPTVTGRKLSCSKLEEIKRLATRFFSNHFSTITIKSNMVEGKSLGFCGISLDVENFLKGKCVLVPSGNIIHMSNF